MFVRFALVVVIALLVWSVMASGSDGAGRPAIYVVKPHDTLWSIATRHYAGDPREGVWRLRERNGLADTVIRPGEKLVLP